MQVMPGTQKMQLPQRETYALDNALSRGQEIALEVDESKAVALRLAPGEMSLHHIGIAHGSKANSVKLCPDRHRGPVYRSGGRAEGQRAADCSTGAGQGRVWQLRDRCATGRRCQCGRGPEGSRSKNAQECLPRNQAELGETRRGQGFGGCGKTRCCASPGLKSGGDARFNRGKRLLRSRMKGVCITHALGFSTPSTRTDLTRADTVCVSPGG